MATSNRFHNEVMKPFTIMDMVASRIQTAAKQFESVREAGGGAIVVEINPVIKAPQNPPKFIKPTLTTVYNWLQVNHKEGPVSVSRAYDLLPFQGRYVTEGKEIVDCESVARGKIATLKRVRLSNPEEYASFDATDLPGGADCGYIALRGAVVFIIKDEYGNDLMEVYVGVSGPPNDEEDQVLVLEARDVLKETFVKIFDCQLIGAKKPEPPQE